MKKCFQACPELFFFGFLCCVAGAVEEQKLREISLEYKEACCGSGFAEGIVSGSSWMFPKIVVPPNHQF